MIVVDMTAAQAIKRGARTALIRRSLVPYKQLRQPIIVLREARPEDPPQGEHTMPNHSVLVVSFELQRSEVAPLRLLGRDGQYTQSPALAIHEAGEAVDESTQQRYTDEAKGHDTLRHEQRRERWDLAARLERAEARAAAQGINVSNHRRANRLEKACSDAIDRNPDDDALAAAHRAVITESSKRPT
jgi:hypothetical protein